MNKISATMFWLLLAVGFASNFHMDVQGVFSVHRFTRSTMEMLANTVASKVQNGIISERRSLQSEDMSTKFADINCVDEEDASVEYPQESWTYMSCSGSDVSTEMADSKAKCLNHEWKFRVVMAINDCVVMAGENYRMECIGDGIRFTEVTSNSCKKMEDLLAAMAMKPSEIGCEADDADSLTGMSMQMGCAGTNVKMDQFETADCSGGSVQSAGISKLCLKSNLEDSEAMDCPVSGQSKATTTTAADSEDSEDGMFMKPMSMKCDAAGNIVVRMCKPTASYIDMDKNPVNAATYYDFKNEYCFKEDMGDCLSSAASQQPSYKLTCGSATTLNYDYFNGNKVCEIASKDDTKSWVDTVTAGCTNVEEVDGHKIVFHMTCTTGATDGKVQITPCEILDSTGERIDLDGTGTTVAVQNGAVVVSQSGTAVAGTSTSQITADSEPPAADFMAGSDVDPINGGNSAAGLMAFFAFMSAIFMF